MGLTQVRNGGADDVATEPAPLRTKPKRGLEGVDKTARSCVR